MARQPVARSRRWLRRISIGLAVLVLAAGAAAAGWIWMHGYALSAESARLVYDDLERFDAAVARLPDSQDGWPGLFEADYLAGATRGLNTYAKTYDVTGDRLARMIARDSGGWQTCRLTDHIRAQEPAVRRALEGFERIYFVGYNIVRAFYERTPDKTEAVRRILNLSDYRGFLAESGYMGER